MVEGKPRLWAALGLCCSTSDRPLGNDGRAGILVVCNTGMDHIHAEQKGKARLRPPRVEAEMKQSKSGIKSSLVNIILKLTSKYFGLSYLFREGQQCRRFVKRGASADAQRHVGPCTKILNVRL